MPDVGLHTQQPFPSTMITTQTGEPQKQTTTQRTDAKLTLHCDWRSGKLSQRCSRAEPSLSGKHEFARSKTTTSGLKSLQTAWRFGMASNSPSTPPLASPVSCQPARYCSRSPPLHSHLGGVLPLWSSTLCQTDASPRPAPVGPAPNRRRTTRRRQALASLVLSASGGRTPAPTAGRTVPSCGGAETPPAHTNQAGRPLFMARQLLRRNSDVARFLAASGGRAACPMCLCVVRPHLVGPQSRYEWPSCGALVAPWLIPVTCRVRFAGPGGQ